MSARRSCPCDVLARRIPQEKRKKIVCDANLVQSLTQAKPKHIEIYQ